MSELLDLCDEVLRALRRLADEQGGQEQPGSWQARFEAVASDDEAIAEFRRRTSRLNDVLLSLLKFTAVQAVSGGGSLVDVAAAAGLTRERLRQLTGLQREAQIPAAGDETAHQPSDEPCGAAARTTPTTRAGDSLSFAEFVVQVLGHLNTATSVHAVGTHRLSSPAQTISLTRSLSIAGGPLTAQRAELASNTIRDGLRRESPFGAWPARRLLWSYAGGHSDASGLITLTLQATVWI